MSSSRPQWGRRGSLASIRSQKAAASSPSSRSPSSCRGSPRCCKANILLNRDIRPTAESQTRYNLRRSDMCTSTCIYCDIWKLGLLVYSRAPNSVGENQSPITPRFPTLSLNLASPADSYTAAMRKPEWEYQQQLKAFDSAYYTERMRFKSILLICGAQGASESEGLRAAHDRCLATVMALLKQERALERHMDALREAQRQRWIEEEEEAAEEEMWSRWIQQHVQSSPALPKRRESRQNDSWHTWDSMSGSNGLASNFQVQCAI